MNRFFLRENASRARLQEAAAAQRHRREIVKALSWGQISRRDLIRYGLFTGAGLLAPLRGLSPFAASAYAARASDVPTGLPPSPLGGVRAFTQPLLRFDVLPRVNGLTPEPALESNQTRQAVSPLLGGGTGPIEGRPRRGNPVPAERFILTFPIRMRLRCGRSTARSRPR